MSRVDDQIQAKRGLERKSPPILSDEGIDELEGEASGGARPKPRSSSQQFKIEARPRGARVRDGGEDRRPAKASRVRNR